LHVGVAIWHAASRSSAVTTIGGQVRRALDDAQSLGIKPDAATGSSS